MSKNMEYGLYIHAYYTQIFTILQSKFCLRTMTKTTSNMNEKNTAVNIQVLTDIDSILLQMLFSSSRKSTLHRR